MQRIEGGGTKHDIEEWRRSLATSSRSSLRARASGSSTGGRSAGRSAARGRSAAAAGSAARGCTVGVSWNNFQQPRWAAHDKPNIQKTIEAGGGKYIDADANLSNEQQLTDIDTLISKGAKVLDRARPGHQGRSCRRSQKAKEAGIPVIAYDRLIEDPSVLYITFDNVGVGKAEADAIIDEGPEGQLRPDQGRPGRPERQDLPARRAGTGRPEGQGRLRRHQDPRTGGRHVHRRLEDREGPDQHGSDHRQGRRRRHEDRRDPGRERQHGARRRRRAHRPRTTASRPSAARTATPPT